MNPESSISIFGLGYVGAVTAGCLAEGGHSVIGVDISPAKVARLQAGESSILEPLLDEILAMAKNEGRIHATVDVNKAVAGSDYSIVCVGTPSLVSGRLNLDFVRAISAQLRDAITAKKSKHTLIYRSTMLPGSTRQLVNDFFLPLIEQGLLEVFYCPEFLREGTAVADFRTPSLCILGTSNGKQANLKAAFPKLWPGEPRMLAWEGSEMIKYACNYYHALKVSFGNEIGRLSKHLNLDGREVMSAFCEDVKLNISSKYLKPGNPFGGSCLPKDLAALSSFARMEGISTPLLENVTLSNQAHHDHLLKVILEKSSKKVGLIGLAFKQDTDDLRGSPMVSLAETLLGRGYALQIYDPLVDVAGLIGGNEAMIRSRLPHLEKLMVKDLKNIIHESEVLVVAQPFPELLELKNLVRKNHEIVDINDWSELATLGGNYDGLCW